MQLESAIDDVLRCRAELEAAKQAKAQAQEVYDQAKAALDAYAMQQPQTFEAGYTHAGWIAKLRKGGARKPERLRGVTEERLIHRFAHDKRYELLSVDNAKLKGLPADELRKYSLRPKTAPDFVELKPEPKS